jgi:hypothetical protein
MQVEKTENEDGPLVSFGPIDPETKLQLSIPLTFERVLLDAPNDLLVTLSCRFNNNKVEVVRLNVQTTSGGNISSRAIAQLGLPAFIREATLSVIPNVDFWTSSSSSNEEIEADSHNFAYLAQIYWLEHICFGAPRQTLMNLLALPRSTCNVLLREIKRTYKLPSAQ